jgi:SAM-dependent methyltransferase
MAEESTWERFFDAHAPVYDDNVFTKNTLAEVEFLLEALGLPEGASVLDVGCGTGRHSIELARRGYSVTGLDLSSEMLARAEAAAQAAGVGVEWLHRDAADFVLDCTFDAAICLCEGSFGLLGQGDDPVEQPLAILHNIAACLKPGAMVLLTVLNAAKMLRKYQNEDVAERRFDPFSLVETNALPPREGMPPVEVRERAFVGTELVLLCRLAGLEVVHLWGGTAGNWGRRPLDLDEFEIMLVARKASESPPA